MTINIGINSSGGGCYSRYEHPSQRPEQNVLHIDAATFCTRCVFCFLDTVVGGRSEQGGRAWTG